MVDFDLLEIKQQIADAKNRIEVANVNEFVNHRPVVNAIDTLNAPRPAVREVVTPPVAPQVAEVQNELDADDRDWDVPATQVQHDVSTSGAAAAAAELVKGRKK
jgi:hypothetical protein